MVLTLAKDSVPPRVRWQPPAPVPARNDAASPAPMSAGGAAADVAGARGLPLPSARSPAPTAAVIAPHTGRSAKAVAPSPRPPPTPGPRPPSMVPAQCITSGGGRAAAFVPIDHNRRRRGRRSVQRGPGLRCGWARLPALAQRYAAPDAGRPGDATGSAPCALPKPPGRPTTLPVPHLAGRRLRRRRVICTSCRPAGPRTATRAVTVRGWICTSVAPCRSRCHRRSLDRGQQPPCSHLRKRTFFALSGSVSALYWEPLVRRVAVWNLKFTAPKHTI